MIRGFGLYWKMKKEAALIKEINQRLRAKIQAGEPLPAERGSAEMVEVVLSAE